MYRLEERCLDGNPFEGVDDLPKSAQRVYYAVYNSLGELEATITDSRVAHRTVDELNAALAAKQRDGAEFRIDEWKKRSRR